MPRFITYTFILFVFGFLAYLILFLNINNNITMSDKKAILQLGLEDVCSDVIGDYTKEVVCISRIQKVVQLIGIHRCPEKKDTAEPSDFLYRGYGCCVEKSRFIEKSARFYGFNTRHLFIIKPIYHSITNFLPLGQESHAASEILTSRGWLGVDSVEAFMLLDQSGNPLTYEMALRQVSSMQSMEPKLFFSSNIDIIFGLYSRHGNFYGLNAPGPEFVFSELLFNINP